MQQRKNNRVEPNKRGRGIRAEPNKRGGASGQSLIRGEGHQSMTSKSLWYLFLGSRSQIGVKKKKKKQSSFLAFQKYSSINNY